MNKSMLRKPATLGFLMLIAAGLTVVATPTRRMADEGIKVNLETMIPESFAEWRIDKSIVPVSVAPDVQAKLDKIYNQTLARTYVNPRGQRVMLSIAYGGDQSDALQVHTPEMCYTAQGFQVLSGALSYVTTTFGELAVKRLLAVHGSRREPITYWITIGEHVARTNFQMKLAQLRYGFVGRIPDGMLVRVSTLSKDDEKAHQIQDLFIRDLLLSIDAEQRVRVAGKFGV